METTCAIILIDKDGRILGCHGTGKPNDCGYDFPKGCVDGDNESHFEAACRELKEETGLILEELDKASEYIIDCGVYPHNSHKKIHMFICGVNTFPALDDLKCTTYFTTNNGVELPEMDGYKIIAKDERKIFNKVLWNKFEMIDDFNSRVEYK